MGQGISDHETAWRAAVVVIDRTVRREANIMGFNDTFFLLGACLIAALIASLFLEKPAQLTTGGAH
jgi:MFS transporter, DHA2 family, multidrug resistance protein